MDIQWQDSIHISVPVEKVYAYLADFPRHTEWAQTLASMKLAKAGDATGHGAQYITSEKQAMRADRKPGQALTKGMPATTLCEVTVLIPNQRIAWKARMLPNTGMNADYVFELSSAADDTTTLTQHVRLHIPAPMAGMFKLMFGRDLDAKSRAQYEAGLRNIKTLVESGASQAASIRASRGSTLVVA